MKVYQKIGFIYDVYTWDGNIVEAKRELKNPNIKINSKNQLVVSKEVKANLGESIGFNNELKRFEVITPEQLHIEFAEFGDSTNPEEIEKTKQHEPEPEKKKVTRSKK